MNFKENESVQKLRGGYYTPNDLAHFISQWVATTAPKRILEPSCGDGRFFRPLAAHTSLRATEVTAFELDAAEAEKARSHATELRLKATVRPTDFLGWAVNHIREGGERFDAAVGNPPFVRYQYLPENFQKIAEQIFQSLDCKFTKHTNAWVPFVLASIALLRPGGRLGMVVPAEIIHVMHAQSLRSYLGKKCRKIVIIDPQQLWFEGTLQGAVILLAETCADIQERPQGLGIIPVGIERSRFCNGLLCQTRAYLGAAEVVEEGGVVCVFGVDRGGIEGRAGVFKGIRPILDAPASSRSVFDSVREVTVSSTMRCLVHNSSISAALFTRKTCRGYSCGNLSNSSSIDRAKL